MRVTGNTTVVAALLADLAERDLDASEVPEGSLTTTKPVESMIAITRTTQRDVRRRRDAAVARRCTPSGC